MAHLRHRGLLGLLLGIALLGLPVVSAGAATAAETWETDIVFTAGPTAAVYGSSMKLSGQLGTLDPNDQHWYAIPDATVELQRKLAGQSSYVTIDDTMPSGADGTFSFFTKATKNASYQLVYAGGSGPAGMSFAPATSDPHNIKVSRDLNARSIEKAKVYLAGNVDPGWNNKTVYLQKKACSSCAWKAYTKQKTTATGGFKFLTPAPKQGKWRWRAYVPAADGFVKSFTPVLVTYTQYY